MTVFFIPLSFQEQQEVILENNEFHHLSHVTRAKEGTQIELVNGKGELAQATILRLEKKLARLSIDLLQVQEKPSKELILAQALPRINRLDFIMEKGTELGATQFWLFPGVHSERKMLTEHQVERLQSLTIAAMKQCGRLFLPKIEIMPPLVRWNKCEVPAFYGDIAPLAEPFYKKHKEGDSCLFFIGPESGFSDEEIAQLNALGVMGVKLHENILRTDTAALVALSFMNL